MVVSDLHIGFEAALNPERISLDLKGSLYRLQDDLRKLLRLCRTDKLILLGDIKASVSHITKQEWQDVPEFFKFMSKYASIYLVPGNHDGNIGLLVPESVTISSVKGMVLVNTLLTHGHVMPPPGRRSVRRIVMGHIHPTFSKENSILNSQQVWLFLRARKDKIFDGAEGLVDLVILPRFNKEIYPTAQRTLNKISPILKRVFEHNTVQRALAITLDGSIVADGRDALAMLFSRNASNKASFPITD